MSTNEQLVARIRAGERDLLPVLWEQVRRFVEMKAGDLARALHGRFGVEKSDLVSSAYIGMVKAVSTFDLGAGCAFITWFGFHLRNAFAEACGFRTSKHDLLDQCDSLDRPQDTSDPEGVSLYDSYPDPDSAAGYDRIEQDIYITQLRHALDIALDDLPPEEAEAIRTYFFDDLTGPEGAATLGISKNEFHRRKDRGLRAIRRGKHFPSLAEFSPYAGTGLAAWKATGCSVEERYVCFVDDLEQRERKFMSC